MNFVLLLALTGLVHALRSYSASMDALSTGTTLAFGYLLLTAFFVGGYFKAISLPKLTGYLVTGIVVGPPLLDLVSRPMLANLEVVNGMAIALIALSAGAELGVSTMRPLARTIGWVTALGLSVTIVLLSGALLGLYQFLPFFGGLGWGARIAVALMMGVVMSAQSPSVVIALRDELQANGPIARTAMGVVVVADLSIIVLFALVSAIAKAALGEAGTALEAVAAVTWELMGSVVFGAVLGVLLAQFLKRVAGSAALFVMLLAFVMAEVGQRLDLDPLLLALAAGVTVRNFSGEGEKLHSVITAAGLPVYVLFFAVAGASLHVETLMTVGLIAPIIAVVRAIGLLSGGKLGAKLADAPADVRRFAPYGLLPQAGLALALSHLMVRSFPSLGAEAGALTLAIVALNELVAPVVYRWALVKSGEATLNNGEGPAVYAAAGGH